MKYKDIAKSLNIGVAAVTKYCKKLKIRDKDLDAPSFHVPLASIVKPLDEIHSGSKNDRAYAARIFDLIDTEQKAYWLGLFYADGHVSSNDNTISLALKESDKNHVERFRDFVHMNENAIQKKIRKLDGKEYVSYSFSFANKATHDALVRLGCPSRKTFILKFPDESIVPKHLMRHFVRGYYDGDGSCTHGGSSKISLEILGTSDFLNGYQAWTGIEHQVYGFDHSTINRSIYSGPYAIYILDNLYDNASIYLPRKYETYLKERRLALQSIRTARLLVGKIGEGLTGDADANTEVTPTA